MKYTKPGNTDIKVSKICVGGMSFGEVKEGGHQWTLDQKLTQKMLAKALDLGVNFIDTANVCAGGHLTYTGWESDSKRSNTDKVIRGKYDAYKENDLLIINCVGELAKKYDVSMTRIALA